MAVDAAPQPTALPRFAAAYLIRADIAGGVAAALIIGGYEVTPAAASGPGQIPRYTVQAADPTTRGRVAGLSEREMQVLARIARGMSNGQIGEDLFLAEQTVKSHCYRLFRKLGAKDRANAVAIGYQRGLLGQAAA